MAVAEPLVGYPTSRRSPRQVPLTLEERRAEDRARVKRDKQRYPLRTKAGHAASRANARAVRLGVPGLLTRADVLALWVRQPACVGCGVGIGLDHVRAMADGGSNTTDNIQTLCFGCNRQKAAVVAHRFETQSHCKRGHALSGYNARRSTSRGKPYVACRTCGVARDRERLRRLRFTGPAPRSDPDGTGPRAIGALGPEESQDRSEASGPLAMPPGALPAAADRALSRGHAHAGLVEPGASSHPRLHPLTSSDTAAAPRGQRAGEIGPSGP